MSEILITLDWMGLRPRGVACQFMQLSCNFRGIKAISNPLATAYSRRHGHALMGKSCMWKLPVRQFGCDGKALLGIGESERVGESSPSRKDSPKTDITFG